MTRIIIVSSLSLSPFSLLPPPPLSLSLSVSFSHSSSLGKPPKPSRSSIEDTAAANQGAEAEEAGEEEEVFQPPSSPPGVSYGGQSSASITSFLNFYFSAHYSLKFSYF